MKIQWYPGHMAKAKRLLVEQLKVVDLILEIRDARVPLSSANKDLKELVQHKPRIIVLNKVDLADARTLKPCIEALQEESYAVLTADSIKRQGLKEIVKECQKASAENMLKRRSKGLLARPTRAMVIGIPNVGKSSFINALVGKGAARTGNKPGVTRGNQWVRILKNLELMDTPGILLPRFEIEETGEFLAFTGAIKEEVFDVEAAAICLINWLKEHHPQSLIQGYDLEDIDIPNHEVMRNIGINACFLDKKSEIQWRRTAQKILHDFQAGRLGRFTLDVC